MEGCLTSRIFLQKPRDKIKQAGAAVTAQPLRIDDRLDRRIGTVEVFIDDN
ncbi:Uncharacterised protein [Brucella melitensis]|nr:Uncharacterised protein [Brucella melitensis]